MDFKTITKPVDTDESLEKKAPKEELYGFAVDTAVLFSDHKDIHRARIERHQRHLLSKLSYYAPFLGPGEKVLHVISGCSPVTFVEQVLTALLLLPLKRSLFIITNRRILHVPVTSGLRHRYSISQVLYADCRYIRMRWATIVVKYKSGKTDKLRCISRKGRRKAKKLLWNMPLKGRSSPTMEREHLCPRCTTPLIRDYYACPSCSLEFKRKSWAVMLSIIFPGGGYFYARHPVIGLIEAVMETIVLLLLGASTAAYFMSEPSAPRSIIQAVMLCAIVLGYEKMVTAMFSSKCIDDFIPTKRAVEVMVEKSPSSKKGEDKESLATNWRSM
jgi:hypothetical protein